MIPILVAYVCMLVNVVFSIYTNLRILKSQLLAMSSLNIDPLTTPAYSKYLMFKWLAVATAAYVLMELVIHTSTHVTNAPLWVFLMLHQLMELVCVVAIGVTFRARPFSTMFQQVQEFGLQLVSPAPSAGRSGRDGGWSGGGRGRLGAGAAGGRAAGGEAAARRAAGGHARRVRPPAPALSAPAPAPAARAATAAAALPPPSPPPFPLPPRRPSSSSRASPPSRSTRSSSQARAWSSGTRRWRARPSR